MKARHGKFYAVKKGKNPGVYLTWAECQDQVWGVSNALFRAFPSREEAYDWIDDRPITAKGNICRIYTDGSHQRAHDYLGVGAWCLWNEEEFQYSTKVTREVLDSYNVPSDSECSNPTAELVAMAQILMKFQNCTLKTPIAFVSDYIGVKNWMEGAWKPQEPHIVAIVNVCKKALETIKGNITFEWVKGHSGNIGNTHADRLAGSHDEIDTFSVLIKTL